MKHLDRKRLFSAFPKADGRVEDDYVEYAAEEIVPAPERIDAQELVDLGSNFEIIRDRAETTAGLRWFAGHLVWDTSKSNWQRRRKLVIAGAERFVGFNTKTHFAGGRRSTIDWYRIHRTAGVS